MLQKLLIAFCTIFVLSACGGDLDLGPNQAPPPDTGDGDDGDGDDGDDFEPGEPRIYTYIPFDEEADTIGWGSRCVETCDATATLNWNSDEEVLAAEPLWASDSDQLDIFGTVDEVDDMAGSAASIWVFVTEEYVTDGNMSMHLLLGNAAGLKGVSRPYAPELGWNRIEMWELEAGTGETEVVDGNETTDYGTFLWHDDGFTLRNINEIGVRFMANGKAPEVDGQFWFDNVTMTPASGTGPLIVEADDPNWSVQDAPASVTVQRNDDGVYFEPTTGGDNPPKLVYLLEGPVDMVGRSFDMTFMVDQAFIDSGAAVQLIIQQNFGSYTGEWGCDYFSSGDLTAGEPIEASCSNDNEAFVAEEGETLRLGVQAVDADGGRLTITEMQVNIIQGGGDSGPFEITPTQESVDADTWGNDNYNSLAGVADLSFNADESALSIAPNWDVTDPDAQYNEGERTVMYVAGEDELPDLEGATVGVELYLGDYYITENPGLALQIYIQQNSGSYTGSYGNNIAIDAAEDLGDGWYRFERTMTGVPTDPTAQRVGIKLQGAGLETREAAAEPILLRKITIE